MIYYTSMHKYVFGPVPSRRLGFSLGIDIVPQKYCTFDCIYCQIGKTTNKEITRQGFFNPDDIINSVLERLKTLNQVDYITLSGSGEPTLNSDIGYIIKEIKKHTDKPIAVITNSSFLHESDVINDLSLADVILPSLDAASEDIFRYVNRPHTFIELRSIIDGIKKLSQYYRGRIWLEIMLIKGINDEPEEIDKFKEILKQLDVEKIQLNTVTRPPSEKTITGLSKNDLQNICSHLGKKSEIIASFEKSSIKNNKKDPKDMILNTLRRRPLTLEDIIKITGLSYDDTVRVLKRMETEGLIKGFNFDDRFYYQVNE